MRKGVGIGGCTVAGLAVGNVASLAPGVSVESLLVLEWVSLGVFGGCLVGRMVLVGVGVLESVVGTFSSVAVVFGSVGLTCGGSGSEESSLKNGFV